MTFAESERVHKGCPTCQCESRKSGRTVIYPPNRILYGECSDCGKVRWISETWMYHAKAWTPIRREHCGCCRGGCPTHDREALGRNG